MTEINLIDSHCHIVFENFQSDLDETALRWREAGVVSLLHACVEPSEISSIRALADRFPELRYAVGCHPLDTENWSDNTPEILREAAISDSRVVAIGELGLDLFKDDNLDEQLEILRPQLSIAFDLELPVIIHCRNAAEEMFKVLSNFKDKNICPRGVMHCWGGTRMEMEKFLSLGFYISFSGTVTFPKAAQIHDCAAEVPSDRYLVETDCPFLSPVPLRGKRNEPANVRKVAAAIAKLRGESLESVAEKTTSNARKLFNLP